MATKFNYDQYDELVEIHEINVTPFIDVMLVLLIIFMIAAPLSTVDMKVELPVSSAMLEPKPNKPIFLTLKTDRSLFLNNKAISLDSLIVDLEKITYGNKEQRIFLRADKRVNYGSFMEVMDELRSADYLKIALVSLETTSQR